MIEASFSIGSNIHDKAVHLEQAIAHADLLIGTLMAKSSFYKTSAWGFDAESFLNAVIVLRTDLSPMACLQAALGIEAEMGRKRTAGGYTDRIIDIDLLTYGDRSLNTKALDVPHPRLAARKFVLTPWAEIRPDLEVSGADATVSQLLEQCVDSGRIERISDV